MAGKETPRQRMIGMMYLVLTAMLALNVSEEFMNAFKLVNDGLVTTAGNFSAANKITYDAFEASLRNDPVKTKPFYDKAQLAKKYTSELDAYIETIRFNNVYNRLIAFDSSSAHGVNSYYSDSDLRLTQVFFVTKIGTNTKPPILRQKKYL